jgi:rare lipoprotein A
MRLALCGGVLLAVAGCGENGLLPFGGGQERNAATERNAPTDTVQLVERDVEAPEVFQVSELGLWDGRPSLGGVWVAHPDVTDPERVIIRNEDNGKFVIGALFRREREHPGPRLQVSSDAAAALEMLAGQPTMLNVTALRREEAPQPEPEPEPGLQPDPEAASAALPQAGAGAGATTSPRPRPAEVIDSATLDDISDTAAAALERADEPPAATAQEDPAEEAAAVAAPPPQTAEVPAGAPNQPYVQIGIFSVQANAEQAGDVLRAEGMVPTIRAETSQGTTFWRVLVGPTRSLGERDTLLAKVKELGFDDAYAVRR